MIISELFEAPQLCPECGGISFSDLILAEKKDACYHKVKASAKVWPSAYASGRLVQCRKKGAANYGNKSEGVAEGIEGSVVFSGTGDNGGKYEIIQSGPNDFMIHANGKHIDSYDSLQRAMSVLQNEVPGLTKGVAEGLPQTLRKFVPGYARREIDRKMDAEKFGKTDVDRDANYYRYKKIQDKLKEQGMSEGGNVFMPNIQNTPEYKAGFATGKLPVPHPEGTQQYANYYKGVIDKASPTLSKVGEGEQQKGADYRDPKEVDYDDEYDAMVARVKRLAGLGPLKTVYDPNKRVYRNMPTAVQPKK
jgi:hypothetical protein